MKLCKKTGPFVCGARAIIQQKPPTFECSTTVCSLVRAWQCDSQMANQLTSIECDRKRICRQRIHRLLCSMMCMWIDSNIFSIHIDLTNSHTFTWWKCNSSHNHIIYRHLKCRKHLLLGALVNLVQAIVEFFHQNQCLPCCVAVISSSLHSNTIRP